MPRIKCPKCGEEREEGYVFLDGGSLRWSTEEIENRVSRRYPKGTIKLLVYGTWLIPWLIPLRLMMIG